MRDRFTIHAPAKMNLSLSIKGRQPSGYHTLETLMVPLRGLADTLHFRKASQYRLKCSQEGVPTDERNLVTQVWREFEQRIGRSVNYEVELIKQIPHGAGLGGGSSDAAAVLLALNQETQAGFTLSQLGEIAAPFGTDIPFFLYQKPCLGTSRGEKISPLEGPEKSFRVALFKPAFGVSTAQAYQRWKDSTQRPCFTYTAQHGPYGLMSNDLERPVFEKFPFLGMLKNWLLEQPGVQVALMSGSGSTLFAILTEKGDAKSLTQNAKKDLDSSLFTWTGRV